MSQTYVPDMACRFSSMMHDDDGCLFYQLRVERDHNQFLLLRHSATESLVAPPRCTLVVISASKKHVACPVVLEFDSAKPIMTYSDPSSNQPDHSHVTTRYHISQASRVLWKQFMKQHRDKSAASIVCGYAEIFYETIDDVAGRSINQSNMPAINQFNGTVHTHRARLAIGFRTTKKEKAKQSENSNKQTRSRTQQVRDQSVITQSSNISQPVVMQPISQAQIVHPFTINAPASPSISPLFQQPSIFSPSNNQSIMYANYSHAQNDTNQLNNQANSSVNISGHPSPNLLADINQQNSFLTQLLLANTVCQSNNQNNESDYQMVNQLLQAANNILLNPSIKQTIHQPDIQNGQSPAKRIERASSELVYQLINHNANQSTNQSNNQSNHVTPQRMYHEPDGQGVSPSNAQAIDQSANPSNLRIHASANPWSLHRSPESPTRCQAHQLNQTVANQSINQSINQPIHRPTSDTESSYLDQYRRFGGRQEIAACHPLCRVQSAQQLQNFFIQNHTINQPVGPFNQTMDHSVSEMVSRSINRSNTHSNIQSPHMSAHHMPHQSCSDEMIVSLLTLPLAPLLPPQIILPDKSEYVTTSNTQSVVCESEDLSTDVSPMPSSAWDYRVPPIEQSVNQMNHPSIYQSINQSFNPSIDMRSSTSCSSSGSTFDFNPIPSRNQSIYQSINQSHYPSIPINPSLYQSVSQSITYPRHQPHQAVDWNDANWELLEREFGKKK